MRCTLVLIGTLCMSFASGGCARVAGHMADAHPLTAATLLPNPLPVSPMDPEHLWQQVVDTVDDYFKISREERIRSDGGVVTDGRIHTHPETGATYLEPWRKDSASRSEKWLSTLQSIRRYATVRVAPGPHGFEVEVAVYKDLEDVSQPEFAAVGPVTLRHDETLVRNETTVVAAPTHLGWIPMGRDPYLEQRILAELQGRLAELPPTGRLPMLDR